MKVRIMKVCEDIRASNKKVHARCEQLLNTQTLARYDLDLNSYTQFLQQLENQLGHLASTMSRSHERSFV